MTTAFTYPPYPSLYPAVQRTPERGIATPLGLAGNSQPQHAAPRPMPASEVGTLRAGGFDPTPSESREAAGGVQIPHLHAVSDQPVGHRICCEIRCVRLTRLSGRLIADVSADVRCRTGQHDDNVPEMRGVPCNGKTSHAESFWGTGVALARDASDQGSGVWTTVRAHELPDCPDRWRCWSAWRRSSHARIVARDTERRNYLPRGGTHGHAGCPTVPDRDGH